MEPDKTFPAAAPPSATETSDEAAARKRLRRAGEDETMPLTAHLEELRTRLIYGFVTLFVVFAALWGVSDTIFAIVRRPLGDHGLTAIAPAEAFFSYVKVTFYAAIIVAMPMILYQTWEFVAPGLLAAERRYTGWFVVFGTLFFAIGVLFCYFAVLPFGLDFLLSFGGDQIQSQPTAEYYLGFVVKMVLAFGLIFEMPIVIVFLVRMGLVTPATLAEKRSYVIVGCFIVAAILTPPDVFTQVVMALPMVILYELSIVVGRMFVKSPTDLTEETP
jgi:sec-independent protein translocase protein TatC